VRPSGRTVFLEGKTPMQAITGLGHVAIKVKDIDRTLAFYTGLLGMQEMMRINKDDGSLWIVYLRITDTQFLEVFPGAETERAPGWNTNGLNHICLTFGDLDAVVRELTARGIKFIIPLKTGADRNRQAWIEDPDGNRIELMQMVPDSMQARALERLRQMA
jgi:lactoylglutathione lyase